MEQNCTDSRRHFLEFVLYPAFVACKHRKKGLDEPGVTVEELGITQNLPAFQPTNQSMDLVQYCSMCLVFDDE